MMDYAAALAEASRIKRDAATYAGQWCSHALAGPLPVDFARSQGWSDAEHLESLREAIRNYEANAAFHRIRDELQAFASEVAGGYPEFAAGALDDIYNGLEDWSIVSARPALFDSLIELLPPAARDRVLRLVADRRAPATRVSFGAADLHVAPAFRRPLVASLVSAGDLVTLVGESDSLKTFAALHAAITVGLGRSFGPLPCQRAGVLYFAAEGARGLRVRVRAALVRAGIGPDDVQPAVIFTAGGLDLSDDPQPLADALVEAESALGLPVDLVIIDTWAAVGGRSDEDSAAATSRRLANLREAVRDRAVVIVHHSPKRRPGEARGSSALPAAADVRLWLRRDVDIVTLTVDRVRDGRPVEPIVFRAVPTDTGWNDDDGVPLSSLAMAPAEVAAGAPAARQEGPQRVGAVSEDSAVVRALRDTVAAGPVPRADLVRRVIARGAAQSTVYRELKRAIADGLLVESPEGIAEPLA
jgi:hypothetical protein